MSPRHTRGFTLIELIMSITLIGLMAAVGSTMISDSFTTTQMVNAANASKGQARYILERLAREIREVKHISTGAFCITTMTSTKMVFYKRNTDSTDTSSCTTSVETVTIDGSTSSTLKLGYASVSSTAVLSDQVATSGFTIKYFTSDGTTETTSTSNILFVQLSLTVTDSTSGQSTSERLRVALRNS